MRKQPLTVWVKIIKPLRLSLCVLRLSVQKSSSLVGSQGFVISINLISVPLIKALWTAVWKLAKKACIFVKLLGHAL